MRRYKNSWRVPLGMVTDPKVMEQLLDMIAFPGDELWLKISEPSSYAYEPLDQLEKRVAEYAAPAAAARKRGMKVGINPWPTFGAEESYQEFRNLPPMPFRPMVGMDGKVAKRVACPVSREFLEYSKARYTLFAKAGIDFAWVEDDCRFTHLGGVSYPCFCPECVKGFGYDDRETLVAALNAPENGELRRKWCAYTGDRLAVFCAAVREAIDAVDPAIETPIMTVGYSHTTYAGDYIAKCMKALRAKTIRPGHGFYWDADPMGMFGKAVEASRQVQDAICKDDVQYEEESCPRTPLNKAAGTRFLEMALSIWSGCTGFARHHVIAHGGETPFGYLREEADEIRRTRSFYDRYLSFAHDLPQSGIWAAYTPWKMARMDVTEKGWFREGDPDYDVNRFVDEWPTFGIPMTCQQEGAYATLLQGKTAEVLTNAELEKVFEKPVYVDGPALEALWKRGRGEKCGVKVKSARYGGEEKLADTPYAAPFAGARRSAIFGLAYELEPVCDGVETLAYTARPYGEKDTIACARYGNVVTLGFNPYQYTGTPGRVRMMRELGRTLGAKVWLEPENDYDVPRVSVWVRADEKRAAVLLINAQTGYARPFRVVFAGDAGAASVLTLDSEEKRDVTDHSVKLDGMAPWEMKLVLFE